MLSLIVDKKQKHRTIIFYKNYFNEFFLKQRDKVRNKIMWTLDLERALKIKKEYESENK